ncbi:hypothetical protein EEB13_05370 [Rhodococcus sp. WS3]|uniref:hypothetical protein n=1 Tax=Rhodococcus sp. WS3 TaxID=2486271 RepID=UPI0011417A04|nr:hypothetical protein [Rhodococcus sp. WS3]ROZ49355.1 hypothetical protein EEB13_05370 [Rhodococcus sp. WS3]
MNDFDRQFAIRLPSGDLFLVPEPPRSPLSFMVDPRPVHQASVAVWEKESEAQVVLDYIKNEATKFGVTNIGATIVSRVVGPWGDVNLTGFMAAVEGHANGDSS